LKKKIHIIILTILCLILFFVAGILIHRYLQYRRLKIIKDDQVQLLHEENHLSKALGNYDLAALYDIFNATFRQEVDTSTFYSAVNKWLKGRKVKKVSLDNLAVLGRGGYITGWILFDNNEKTFLYQHWIRNKDGWKLLWLTKILPHTLTYGVSNQAEITKVRNRTLEELISRRGIKNITRGLPMPETIPVRIFEPSQKSNFQIPAHTIMEMTIDEIKAQARKFGALYYLEFATTRILDDVATSYVDIHPLYKNLTGLKRYRGLELFFVRVNDNWEFDSYGSRW
jgi:hypothetical protein